MIKKKVPFRKCIGCLQMKEKKLLIRIVKKGKNEIEMDKTGKKEGRGAYICPNIDCLKKACKSKGLERSFKCAIPKEMYEKLRKELESDE